MLCDLGRVQLADGDVVEEEQRLGAGDEDVVGAHRDEIDADGAVPVQELRELELGAHAVGAADQDRIGHLLECSRREEPAEAADVADDLGAIRGLDRGADRVDGASALGRIYAGVRVGDGVVRCSWRQSWRPLAPDSTRSSPGAACPCAPARESRWGSRR